MLRLHSVNSRCRKSVLVLMPKRTDIHKILIIGSGPIVIGQACEFDYSGTQACKALREEGYKVVLVNSNPATIMTDPEFADATYIEPITPEAVEKIIEREKPNALLPTLGGLTGFRNSCRRITHRLEGIRDRGDARQGRQLRHRLLHREPRSHGRAYGRLDYGRAHPDADRQGMATHARCQLRLHPRDRRRDR